MRRCMGVTTGLMLLLPACWTCRVSAATFPDALTKPPPGWTGPVFKLSQNYPTTIPADTFPWKTIDFKTSPEAYIKSVLQYAYDGNTVVDWQVENNTKRKWYHAPWMHSHPAGREFIHGMTQERTSRAGELAPTQTSQFQNWAVSVYNAPGGSIIGKVWANPTAPDPKLAVFPDGTVAIKLLFTAATPAQVPFLQNSREWQADANRITAVGQTVPTLRLLQIDVAVRDTRTNNTTGWVFGTFIYNKDAPGTVSWDRVIPVGVMWGNDPGVTPAMVAGGTKLQQTWLNPAAKPFMQHYGWADRLNGPVDNKVSSCLSCHAAAQVPQQPGALIPPGNAGDTVRLGWFKNIKAAQPFIAGRQSTDYSLQLSFGIRFFNQAPGGGGPTPSPELRLRARGSAPKLIPREGGPEGNYSPPRAPTRSRTPRRRSDLPGIPGLMAVSVLGLGLLGCRARRRAQRGPAERR